MFIINFLKNSMNDKKNELVETDNIINLEIRNNKKGNKDNLNSSEKNNLDDKNEDIEKEKLENFLNKEKEYKLIITNLEKELEEERNKVDNLKLKESSDLIVNMLKNDISKINDETEEILKLNIIQRKKLENVGKEIDLKLKKINLKVITKKIKEENLKKIDFKNNKKNNKNKDNNNEKELEEEENIKMKDKEIENIKKLIINLKKENELLKEKCNKTKNIQLQFNLKDNKKEKELEIEKLNKDIKIINVKLKEHSKCNLVKEEYEKKIKLIRNDIKFEKSKNNNLKEKLFFLNKRITKLSSFNPSNKQKQFSKMKGSLSQQNIFSTNVQIDNKNVLTIKKQIKDNYNPLSMKISYLNEKELNYLFSALNNDKILYEDLLKKLKIYETNLKTKEFSLKQNIKDKIFLKNEISEKINELKSRNGEYLIQKDILTSQINELTINKNTNNNKLNNLTNQINSISDEIKEKDKNIKSLINQLNTIRDLINNANAQNNNILNIQRYIENVSSNPLKEKIKKNKNNLSSDLKKYRNNLSDHQINFHIKVTKRNNSINEDFFITDKKNNINK